ncbi:MAG: hypothetical protein MJ239_02915 [Bacilli bacterium]|nr:hypothetical protein [Bacilli bacterium]
MEKPLACIEISSGSIKFLLGYILNGQPVVEYTREKKVPGILENGVITDMNRLIKSLEEFKVIEDEKAKMRLNLVQVCLLYPATGLKVYQISKATNVIGEAVEKIDVSNVRAMVEKEQVDSGYTVVNIIPDEFILSDGKRYSNPPIGVKSRTLTMTCKVHVLPTSIAHGYKSALNQAGLRCKNSGVTPYVYSELFKTYQNLPKTYILMDIGAKVTTLSIVGNGSAYKSSFFAKGSDDLTAALSESLDLSHEEAERLKTSYGYDCRETLYCPPLTSQGNGKINQKALNSAIESWNEGYNIFLKNAMEQLVSGYGNKLDACPIILVGGGAALNGIEKLLQLSLSKHPLLKPSIRTVGGRDPRYMALVGLCLASGIYRGTMEDDRHGVITVSRKETPQEQPKKRRFFGQREEEDVL